MHPKFKSHTTVQLLRAMRSPSSAAVGTRQLWMSRICPLLHSLPHHYISASPKPSPRAAGSFEPDIFIVVHCPLSVSCIRSPLKNTLFCDRASVYYKFTISHNLFVCLRSAFWVIVNRQYWKSKSVFSIRWTWNQVFLRPRVCFVFVCFILPQRIRRNLAWA